MKIVTYVNQSNIVVEFQDKYRFRKTTTCSNFRLGQVKNPYDKTVCGVACLGYGKHKVGTEAFTPEYNAWKNMIVRCYSEKEKHKHPAYFGSATVCDEWLNFQTFADWYVDNKYECKGRLHIDKDILINGNMEYAPDKCLLVPQRINMLFVRHPKASELPTGIRSETNGSYSANYGGKYLGTYQTIAEAYKVYSIAKEQAIYKIAEEYKNIIPQKVYEALLRYRVPTLENIKVA